MNIEAYFDKAEWEVEEQEDVLENIIDVLAEEITESSANYRSDKEPICLYFLVADTEEEDDRKCYKHAEENWIIFS